MAAPAKRRRGPPGAGRDLAGTDKAFPGGSRGPGSRGRSFEESWAPAFAGEQEGEGAAWRCRARHPGAGRDLGTRGCDLVLRPGPAPGRRAPAASVIARRGTRRGNPGPTDGAAGLLRCARNDDVRGAGRTPARDKKRAGSGEPTLKVFRRGCLKGPFSIYQVELCCKCERVRYDCSGCTQRRRGNARGVCFRRRLCVCTEG